MVTTSNSIFANFIFGSSSHHDFDYDTCIYFDSTTEP